MALVQQALHRLWFHGRRWAEASGTSVKLSAAGDSHGSAHANMVSMIHCGDRNTHMKELKQDTYVKRIKDKIISWERGVNNFV